MPKVTWKEFQECTQYNALFGEISSVDVVAVHVFVFLYYGYNLFVFPSLKHCPNSLKQKE